MKLWTFGFLLLLVLSEWMSLSAADDQGRTDVPRQNIREIYRSAMIYVKYFGKLERRYMH